MTITKTKDFAKIFAIIAGLLFLVCTALRVLALSFDRMIIMYSGNIYAYISVDYYVNGMAMLLMLAGLTALCFTCKRSAALALPIAGIAVINVYLLISNVLNFVIEYLNGYAMDFVPFMMEHNFNVFYLLSTVALIFLSIQVAISVSSKKGTVGLILFAALTVLFSVLAYGAFFLGDIFEFIYDIGYGLASNILQHLLVSASVFIYGFGILFLSLWLIFRPKTVEVQVKEKKSKGNNTEEVTEDGFIETQADETVESAPTEVGAAPESGEAFTEKAFAEP